MIDIKETRTGVSIQVRVVPRAARTELAGIEQGTLKIRISAPPIEGRANGEVVSFLAKVLRISPSQIAIASGEKSRNKRVEIRNITALELQKRLYEAENG